MASNSSIHSSDNSYTSDSRDKNYSSISSDNNDSSISSDRSAWGTLLWKWCDHFMAESLMRSHPASQVLYSKNISCWPNSVFKKVVEGI